MTMTENQLTRHMQVEWEQVGDWFSHRGQRWARKRWGENVPTLDWAKVWGYLLAASSSSQLTHEQEWKEFVAQRDGLAAREERG